MRAKATLAIFLKHERIMTTALVYACARLLALILEKNPDMQV